MKTLLSGTSAPLSASLQSDTLILTLNRPERANAFTLELVGELQEAFKGAAADPQVRAVVLTGAGRVFGAGQDIEEIKSYGGDLSYREHLLKTYNPLVLQIRQIEKPVIAAVNGPCAGASLGIALACDMRLASDKASFVVGFNGIGLVPDSAVSLLLPALIGLGRAHEYTFTNTPISAEKALEWGLVNRVCSQDELLPETMKLAIRLAAGPTATYGLTKQAFNKAVLPNLEEVLNTEADLQEIAGHGVEHKEGVAAFLEKRTPKYN
ncbi:MAG TPA: enoyl-CoA hydratase-related protein [Pyrinomonadaceae bacterium]|nr:enoyl-CoA hydratase-related protein [Pyrinomonadaceae bacterium]